MDKSGGTRDSHKYIEQPFQGSTTGLIYYFYIGQLGPKANIDVYFGANFNLQITAFSCILILAIRGINTVKKYSSLLLIVITTPYVQQSTTLKGMVYRVRGTQEFEEFGGHNTYLSELSCCFVPAGQLHDRQGKSGDRFDK